MWRAKSDVRIYDFEFQLKCAENELQVWPATLTSYIRPVRHNEKAVRRRLWIWHAATRASS